jgi:hypothetical protein
VSDIVVYTLNRQAGGAALDSGATNVIFNPNFFGGLVDAINRLLPLLLQCGVYLLIFALFATQMAAVLKLAQQAGIAATPTDEDLSVTARFTRNLLMFRRHVQSAFCVGGAYGLISTHLVRTRSELTLEVSDDRAAWQAVEFRYKPGSQYLAPKSPSPFFHMPRLDWAMSLLPLLDGDGSIDHREKYPRWLFALMRGVLEGNRDVLSLLHPHTTAVIQVMCDKHHRKQVNDGDNRAAPRWIRVSLDNYTRKERTSRRRRSNTSEECASSATPGCYWSVVRIEQVVSPLNVSELSALLRGKRGDDQSDEWAGNETTSMEEAVYMDILRECCEKVETEE